MTQRQQKLKEILEYFCGFRGTNITVVEIEEELEKLFNSYPTQVEG